MKDPNQKHTDKQLLVKGIKILAISVVLIIASTYLLTFSFLNKDVLPLYLLLPLAIITMGATIYLIFKGLKLILKAVFNN
ncbi:MAG: hypothetical protein CMC74_09855 [Flavobacteriaceae bacterium]|nr:hypothetical protein [Flavobacteriaceae bacterium]|tara:strand:+ start:85043 stop:85282 length:240 start_codon:yes stop_codon:yes gene_type:complete